MTITAPPLDRGFATPFGVLEGREASPADRRAGFSILFMEIPGGDPLAMRRFMEREGFTHATLERLASDGVAKIYRLSTAADAAPTIAPEMKACT
ncbi:MULTISPECIES: hypothetical protein [Bradyrhizobium]|uniref:hypothetical protein n=1 Tax=Bradyrhizobium TaxID=374 RepID=UPI0004BA7C87|nr:MULTISPECIES: hypothetical protein [Bradyrhizobium]MCA1375707.1 hypothetical protein [Bradyrhizobium sp. IC4060]MCA1485697.1 hypothetical protein [Bradyrhizobium sp. IC4061]